MSHISTSVPSKKRIFNGNSKITDLARYGLFAALIAAGAFIKIPIPVVPITLQYIFVNISALLLGKKGAIPVAIYVLTGLCGIPIFTMGGGFSYVLKPTFGYLIGFIVGAFASGTFIDKLKSANFKTMIISGIINIILIYIFGLVYYYLIVNYYIPDSSINIDRLLLLGLLPTVPGDVISCLVSALICVRLKKILFNHKKTNISSCNMSNVSILKSKVLNGYMLTKDEILSLCDAPLEELCKGADEIRNKFCGNIFDMCSIINGKIGGCTENCKFCAQSKHYNTHVKPLGMPSVDEIVNSAKHNYSKGVLRFSIVTAGRALNDEEVDLVCIRYKEIGDSCNIYKCASHGLLTKVQLEKLKEVGVKRYHNNLETSRRYFSSMCTTHSYDDKINTIKAAQEIGLEVCSGGIFGIGETMEDRIDMALELRELSVKSIPVNIINPIPGTPYMGVEPLDYEIVMRIVAIFRFIIPDSMIRIAGGRSLLSDKGAKLFISGANAVATGDMLTTSGISIDDDIKIAKNAGYSVFLH